MSKHKAIPKATRLLIYEKCNQRCAYCGCKLEYKEMQVDHVSSIYANSDFRDNMTEKELYNPKNLLPACRQCNFYKSTFTLEKFRERLATVMMENLRKDFSYRLALKYGMIEEHVKPLRFYFEILEDKQ